MSEENGPIKMDRSDRATRMFLEGLDELAGKIRQVELEIVRFEATLRHYVSYAALVGFLLTTLAGVLGLMAWFGNKVTDATDAIRQENVEARKGQAAQLQAQTEDIAWIRSKVDGSAALREPQKPRKGAK